MSTSAQQLTDAFAIGSVWFNPTGGLLPANPTPQELKTIQEISVDWKGKNVELRGQYLVPVDARIADVSITGKFTVGTYNLNQLNQLLFAGVLTTSASAIDRINADEAHTITEAGSPPTVNTITVTNSATFTEDLGVSLGTSSAQFVRVASSPSQGQYSVAAGVYTFNIADVGSAVVISYVDNGGAGASLALPNNLQGQSPIFELDALIPAQDAAAGFMGYRFYNCRATGMKLLTGKNNDFQKVEVDFSVFCPIGQNVGELIQTNV